MFLYTIAIIAEGKEGLSINNSLFSNISIFDNSVVCQNSDNKRGHNQHEKSKNNNKTSRKEALHIIRHALCPGSGARCWLGYSKQANSRMDNFSSSK